MDKNKDYIINLRVSRATYEKIKSRAKENGETISNLVRKAIDDGTEIISDISDEVFGKKKDFSDVLSYSEVEAAQDMRCDKCGKDIKQGAAITAGENRSGKRYYFCKDCK